MLPIDIMIMKKGSVEGLVELVNFNDTDMETSPGPAVSGITVSNDGSIYTVSPPPSGAIQDWLLQGSSSDYDVKMVPISGTFTSGSTGLWQNLGTTRTWTLHRTTPGESETQAIMYIKLASGSTPIANATVNLTSIIEF